jgi:hypothetical protein
MRVFDGEPAPEQVAGNTYGGAEGEHRADRVSTYVSTYGKLMKLMRSSMISNVKGKT